MDDRPLCVKDNVRMENVEIGVETLYDKSGRVQYGDLYKCPVCKFEIITELGEPSRR